MTDDEIDDDLRTTADAIADDADQIAQLERQKAADVEDEEAVRAASLEVDRLSQRMVRSIAAEDDLRNERDARKDTG